jgi:hypothetical protein
MAQGSTSTTEISAVKLIAMAYAWSQIRLSYILFTCGSTEPSDKLYMSFFEDDFGKCRQQGGQLPKTGTSFLLLLTIDRQAQ